MIRPLASRRSRGIALAVFAGTGIGLGAYGLGSASEAAGPPVPRTVQTTTASALVPPDGQDTATPATAPAEAPASSPLTLDEAKAVAVQVAPGRVVEWDEDYEPTGLRYDVTVLHDDGSTTEVEVDTVTGQVTSVNHDNDWD